jgi:cysteine desulfurase
LAVIYLDNNATTKPFPEVVEVMTQFMTSRYWNASSAFGQLDGLEEVVESAKEAIRNLIDATPEDEVVFTSGATESNAWAVAEGARRAKDSGWVLSSEIEHPSVRDPLESFQAQGVEVRWVPVARNGVLDLHTLTKLVDSDLCFASLMYAHNETGVIQPIREAALLIRERAPHCLIHTDATQAIGKIPISFSNELQEVDLISFSGHKFHGPKGIGGLIIRNDVRMQPLILGGGQQNNLRSGTLNIPAIAGISVAASKSMQAIQRDMATSIQEVRDYFEARLTSLFNDSYILGSDASRLPNTSFFGINSADADDIVYALAAEGLVLSKGSSCSAQSIKPPLVAQLMAYTYEESSTLLRFSASFENTRQEVDRLVNKLHKILKPEYCVDSGQDQAN